MSSIEKLTEGGPFRDAGMYEEGFFATLSDYAAHLKATSGVTITEFKELVQKDVRGADYKMAIGTGDDDKFYVVDANGSNVTQVDVFETLEEAQDEVNRYLNTTPRPIGPKNA